MEGFDANEFLQTFKENPTPEALRKLRKDDLAKLCACLKITVKSNMRKFELLQAITEYFVREGSLEDVTETASAGEDNGNQKALELRRLELEFELKLQQQKLEAERRLQERKLEAELELQQIRLQAESELNEKKLQAETEIEVQRLKLTHQEAKIKSDTALLKTTSLVPKFSEREVEQFFQCFERTAETVNWPKEKWTLMIQASLVGKAQRVYTALPKEDAKDYTIVKQAILQAYELVPEAYRQKFRGWKKGNQQSYLEFAKDKELFFDKWCRSEEVETLEDLTQLILVEEFKNCVNPAIRTHLDEKSPKRIADAARLADQFDLTHRAKFNNTNVPRKPIGAQIACPASEVAKSDISTNKPANPDSRKLECDFCKRRGHTKDKCWQLHGKPNTPNRHKEQPVSCATGKASKVMNDDNRPSPTTLEREETLRQEGEKAFCSKGKVATNQSLQGEKPITVWRDTGSFQSLLREDALPLSEQTATGTTVRIFGVGGCISAPLHKVYVDTDVVKGEISVAIVKELPIKGVDLLLGNEIAGSKIGNTTKMTPNSAEDEEKKVSEQEDQSQSCAVTTRSKEKTKTNEATVEPAANEVDLEEFEINRANLIREQEKDSQLSEIADALSSADSETENIFFYKNNGVLMRRWKPPDAKGDEDWKVIHQIVLPAVFRNQVLKLAHDCPLSGHLGVRKTLYRINRHFFWPRMRKDIASYCKTCHVCQVAGKPQHKPQKVPLIPIPALEEPFNRIICDCVGPLPKSKSGHEYLFTIMCSSTRFPVAIPLRSINAKNICEALINFFSIFGLPKQIQTDQGSNFMSKVFQQLSAVLGIKHVYSTAYHPESQGALERFHQTLKSMMRTYCEGHKDWSAGIPLLLFAVRETVQESLGFSPFELVYGHEPRGPLKLMKEKWLDEDGSNHLNLLEYVSKFKERLYEVREVAKVNLKNSQERMKRLFDAKAEERTFEPGDKALVFLPLHNDPLKAKYFGPYKVLKKVNDVNYLIETPDRRKRNRLCHINMLKTYYEREDEACSEPKPVTCVGATLEEEPQVEELSSPRLKNSEILNDLDSYLSHLEEEQRKDLEKLMENSSQIFADRPSVTDWISHDVDVQDSRPTKQRPYREHPEKRDKIRKEISYMKENGIIEDSSSDWSSPCVMVPKSDGTFRLCTDFRKVNSVTVADNYPLPRIEDCVEKVGQAKYISKIDLLKGYYQVPLTERAKKISAFVTNEGFHQYRVMAFGMCNASATFQRLANKLIQGLDGCAVYIDDLIVFSNTWPEHVQRLESLFNRLKAANLTTNLAKSEFGKSSLEYLGFKLGRGTIQPLQAKINAVLDFPRPTTRKELRRFLGMIGFYRKFCQNFSEVVSPLTDMTSPKTIFHWTKECEAAFEQAKLLLSTKPVLAIPNFEKPFRLMTDASNSGTGAVLFQTDENGNDHPVAFYSKKFDKHQRNYSTIEKEAFAVIDSLKHFAYYVKCGEPVEVYTDHNPLVFLNKMKNDNQRLLRWSLALQEFNVVIKHIRGSQNVVADCLSRPPDWGNREC